MTTFHVLVVDDEPLAREVAVSLLRRDPEVAIGRRMWRWPARTAGHRGQHGPTSSFSMSRCRGWRLELAEQLQRSGPVVVFITAFSQYAVDAFDLAATDYVLKPFSDERFLEALGRAKRRVRERRLGELAHQMAGVAPSSNCEPVTRRRGSPRYLQRLSIKQGDRRRSAHGGDRLDRSTGLLRDSSFDQGQPSGSRVADFARRAAGSGDIRSHASHGDRQSSARSGNRDRDGLRLVLSEGTQVGVSRSRRSHVESLLSPRLR